MANLDVGSQGKELFETTGARELTEQEIETMFDDKFFDNLESSDPLIKIEKQEIGGKVYFEKPDPNTNKIRKVGKNGVFVDKFFVSNETWNNIVNRRNGVSGAIQVAQTETQQLNQNVTSSNTSHESPETQQLKQNVTDTNTSYKSVEGLGSYVEAHADELLNRFDEFDKRPIPKRLGESHKTKERLKSVVRNDIAYLKSIKRELKRYKYTYNPEIFQKDLDELENHRKILEDVRQRVVRGDDTSDIPTILGSLRDVKRADKFENKMAKYNQKVNEILKDATLKRLWNEDTEGFQDYLEDVWSGAIEHPEQCRFYKQHERDFLYILSINPTLYAKITTCQNPRRQNTDQYTQQCIAQCTNAGRGNGAGHCETFATGMGRKTADLVELIGLNKEKDPRKRQAWEKIGSIAAVGGAIFLGIQFFKNLFSSGEKNKNKWRKVAGYGAGLLALLKNDEVLKLAQDVSGWHPEEKATAKGQIQTYGYTQGESGDLLNYYTAPSMAVLSTMSTFPVSDIISQNIIQTGNNGLIFNYDNYVKYIEALSATNPSSYTKEWKERVLQDAKKLAESENMFRAGLTALGITGIETLQTMQQKGQTLRDAESVHTSYTQYMETLLSGIGADLYKQGLKAKPECILLINEDLQNSNNKDELIVKWLKAGYLTSTDSDKNYELEEIINDPNIDLKNKTMKGFVNSGGMHIKFDSYEELFDTAHLTNRIKINFAGRPAVSKNPFHIDVVTRRLEFDDVEWYRVWKNETSILKARTFKKTSSILSNNKQFYVDYLNRWWNENQKQMIEQRKIDLSRFPMLKEVGINFVDENEAEKAEELLKYIKHELRMWEKRDVGKAFEISNIYLGLTTKTRIKFFTKQSSKIFDISDFPTLIREQGKLLSYLNNPDNKMRGSER